MVRMNVVVFCMPLTMANCLHVHTKYEDEFNTWNSHTNTIYSPSSSEIISVVVSVFAMPSAQQKYLSMMLVISEAASISRIDYIMLLSSLRTVLWNVILASQGNDFMRYATSIFIQVQRKWLPGLAIHCGLTFSTRKWLHSTPSGLWLYSQWSQVMLLRPGQ